MTSKNSKHKAAMQSREAAVDASVEAASEERGIAILLTRRQRQDEFSLRYGNEGEVITKE